MHYAKSAANATSPTDRVEMNTGYELILLLKDKKERVVPDLPDP